jgi:hypothetical protein
MGKRPPASRGIEILTDIPALTVAALRFALHDLPDEMWVLIDGRGPLVTVISEPGANEPFVVLAGAQETP